MDIIASKTICKYKNVKIVLSHGGGTLSYLIGRPASVIPYLDETQAIPDILEDAKEFYDDTAVSGSENVLTVLEKFAKPGHITYSSDYPYANYGIIDYHTDGLDKFEFKVKSLLNQINRKNALKLFPRFSQ